MLDPERKKKLEKILKIVSALAIISCCVLLFPQVRSFIIEIAEKTLGRDLRNHDKWMNLLLGYSLFVILCFSIILVFLNELVIKNILYKFINYRHKNMIICIMLFFAVFVLELIFFRGMIFNRDNIAGDMGDSRLVSLIMEHWYKVFCGQEAIRDLSMFYPVKNTLGYSDVLFLLSLPYSFLRVIGYQWMTAYQLTLIGTHFFGGLCLAWFLRKSLKLSFWGCVIGLIIGNFSNSYFIKIMHTQFVTFSLVPLLFILLKNFYDCFNPDLVKKRKIYGILTIFLFAGIISTSFYIGFFTALFLLILLIVLAVYLLKKNSLKVKQLLEIVKTYKFEIIMYFVCGIIALLPFLWVYMPIYNEMGARSWGETAYYLPHWYDLFNISPQNLIWSFPNSIYELQVGYPLITGILLIVICTFYIKQSCNASAAIKNTFFIITIGFSFTIAIISLSMLKFEILNTNFSLWFLIYKLIPGASAIRAVARFSQFLSLPAGILIAVFLSERVRFSDKTSIKSLLACTVLVMLIFLEHQNTTNNCDWTKSSMNIYLEKVSSPPDDCESFFLVNNTNSTHYLHHLDAWSIANKFNTKTINGYSGVVPKNWQPMWEMEKNKNYTSLSYWINEYNLENVYLYDYINDNWIKCTEDALEELQSNIGIEYLTNRDMGRTGSSSRL
jgi:hypothetical protein